MVYKCVLLICWVGLLSACGGGSSDVAQNVTQVATVNVEATVTAAVMTAVAEINAATQTPVPTPTPEAITATPIPAPTEVPAAATPTEAVPVATIPVETATAVFEPNACLTRQGVNFRYGPGISYNPPLRTLASGEPLAPLAFSATGYPDGQWLQVEVASTGEIGWLTADPQFVICNFALSSLPPATTILPTPTAQAAARPNVQEKATGGGVDSDPDVDFQYQYNKDFLLRLDIKNNHDLADVDVNGRGISKVTFEVVNEATGITVYTHQEGTAGYCIFRGGEPDCQPWPQNGNGRYTWGEGGAEVEPGSYRVNVVIYPKNPEFEEQSWSWGTTFDILP